MKEAQTILAAARVAAEAGRALAIATVVSVEGSSYRRPGARMLIEADGRTSGGISGGCLERDVVDHAKQAIVSGVPLTLTYDTTLENDLLLGTGLGCRGVIQILVEPIDPSSIVLASLAHVLTSRQPVVLAHVYRVRKTSAARPGDRVSTFAPAISENERPSPLREALAADLWEVLQARQSVGKTIDFAGGEIDVFIEFIPPSLGLVIFGTGADVLPVVKFAADLGWHVTVVDPRCSTEDSGRIALADRVISARPNEIADVVFRNEIGLHLDENTAAVLMTHNHQNDLEILRAFAPLQLKYLGVLGPRRRTENLLSILSADPALPVHSTTVDSAARSPELVDRIFGPVGLDIGAQTPDEIALAIVAEIQAVTRSRSGKFLRDRARAVEPTSDSFISAKPFPAGEKPRAVSCPLTES